MSKNDKEATRAVYSLEIIDHDARADTVSSSVDLFRERALAEQWLRDHVRTLWENAEDTERADGRRYVDACDRWVRGEDNLLRWYTSTGRARIRVHALPDLDCLPVFGEVE